jgi:uncharacterized protein YjbJ (UPF0337 family)
MEERLEQLVSQFGNPAEIEVKVGRSKIWPLREGRVTSPESVDKFELAINQPDQLTGTVNVSRGGETIYRVSRGTVDIDEREALEFLTEIELLPEAVNELEPQPEYLELLNSRLERVGQEGWTLDELRTDVEQGRAESGNSFVSSFDDIVIREGLERGLSQEQTLAVLDRSPTLEGLPADEVARYRTQFETQYSGESARQSRIQDNRDFMPEAELRPENEAIQDVLEPEDSNAINVNEDMGFPEDLPEDENLIQDEGMTFGEVAEIEDIEPEDSTLPSESLESFDTASDTASLDTELEEAQGDLSVPEDVPEPAEPLATASETVVFPGLDADLTREVGQAVSSTPELGVESSGNEPVTEAIPVSEAVTEVAQEAELLTQPQAIDEIISEPEEEQVLVTEAIQSVEPVDETPFDLEVVPNDVADDITASAASEPMQELSNSIYAQTIDAYQEKLDRPLLNEITVRADQNFDKLFTDAALDQGMSTEQYQQGLSQSPYVLAQIDAGSSAETVATDYTAPLVSSYESQLQAQQTYVGALEAYYEANPTLWSYAAQSLPALTEAAQYPQLAQELDQQFTEGAQLQGMSKEQYEQALSHSPYVRMQLDAGDSLEDISKDYITPLSTAYETNQVAQVTESIQLDEMVNESAFALDAVATEIPEAAEASDVFWEGPTAEELDAAVDHSLNYYEAQPFLEPPQSLEAAQSIEIISENSPDLAVAISDVTETPTPEAVPESIPALHTIEPLSERVLVQAVSSDQSALSYSPYLATASENSQIAQIVKSINKPLDVPLDHEPQQAALAVHFSSLPDVINQIDVLNGALASAEPRLQSLQDGFTAVEFEVKNLAQHINEGKFSDWASTQGKRVETAAQTMTENVKGRFGQWIDNAKAAAKGKVQEVSHTLMEKFEKAVALVDSKKLETVAPVLPSQVDNYKIETEQGLRISRDGVPIYEDGKCTPNISTWDAVFIGRLSERAEKNVSSMVEGLATLGGEVQPNGDRTFSVGAYTMSRAENGAVKLNEASRGEILRAHNGKIRSSMTAEDYSRFQKFQQNTQVAVKAPAMAKGGIELG